MDIWLKAESPMMNAITITVLLPIKGIMVDGLLKLSASLVPLRFSRTLQKDS